MKKLLFCSLSCMSQPIFVLFLLLMLLLLLQSGPAFLQHPACRGLDLHLVAIYMSDLAREK